MVRKTSLNFIQSYRVMQGWDKFKVDQELDELLMKSEIRWLSSPSVCDKTQDTTA